MRDLTPRIAAELIAHEGIVTEAYRDSTGVWTWSVGITDASGHRVHPRYRDRPQPLEHCLAVYLWLLRTRYLPAVLAAFGACDPAEHELGAALSFHWHTGAIGRAAWLRRFIAGDTAGARVAMLDWRRPPEVLPRRRRERALFFDGVWSGGGTARLYTVAKPSYRPVRGRAIAIRPVLERLFAAPSIVAVVPPPCPAPPHPVLEARPVSEASPAPAPTTWFDSLWS